MPDRALFVKASPGQVEQIIMNLAVADPFHTTETAARVAQKMGPEYHEVKLEATLQAYTTAPAPPTAAQPKRPD